MWEGLLHSRSALAGVQRLQRAGAHHFLGMRFFKLMDRVHESRGENTRTLFAAHNFAVSPACPQRLLIRPCAAGAPRTAHRSRVPQCNGRSGRERLSVDECIDVVHPT